MVMPAVTLLSGLLLIAVGVGFGATSDAASWTKFIPAILGAAMLLCGAFALRKPARKHAIHAALVVALVGIVGSGMRIPKALGAGSEATAQALASQLLTLLICAGYLALGIRSFIAARRARKQAKLAGNA